MSIKILGSPIIDNDKNFVNVGILTVGTGSSSIVISPDSSFLVGAAVTFNGSTGNFSTDGTIKASALSLPLSLG